MLAFFVFFAGINLGFRSPQEPQLNHNMWLDACFKTVAEEYLQNLKSEKKENFNLQKSDDEVTSLSLPADMILYPSPNESDQEFEIPPADSGETKLLDSTFTKIDSSLISLDSTNSKIDTVASKDTVKIDWREIDSTARLEQFKYRREDKPYVEPSEGYQSKLFLQPSPTYKKRIVTIDSTGKYVEVREKIGDQEPKLALRMPLEDYINLKIALKEREDWEKLAYAYQLKEGKAGLGELITSFTDFEIPLPSVGVLSIFGEPKISLKIGGSVQIHGAWRSETTEGVTASRLGNTRNEPDFKQQVQINVNGTIGDKLNISADWNTERTFEYENQLKIKYTGYEDEIIQSIEAGNVSMQTPSLIGGAEALFGVKAQFKMGPFKLTALASQKKGETKEVAVSGGSTSQDYSIRAYDYSENHYFVDKVYADRNLKIFENFYNKIPSQVNTDFQINEIEVWKSINQIVADQSKIRYANCYIDLKSLQEYGGTYPDSLRQPLDNPIAGKSETGRFLLLQDGVDYTLHPETGYISFKTSLNDQDIIAVSFKQGPSNITYGQFTNTLSQADTFIVLKLVKPKNLQPQFTEAWSLRLKNIYPTGARNVTQDGFEFKILYEPVGQDPTEEIPEVPGKRLIQAFGLDKQGAGGSPTPDNIFDWRPGITIFPETGEVVFPTLEPFGKDIPQELQSKAYQSVYDTTKTFARQDKGPDKWALSGKNTGQSSAVYQLGFNVVENSVRVVLNGRELREGVDYTVDYNIGQLTIRNDAALVPGADLKITYEQNDLFQLASKTLLGARGIYDFSEKTSLGFTLMNLNQQTLSDKVRIGEEPLSNTIMGADFKTSANLPFLTKLLDLLISTKEMSTFTFNGEYAYMSPDPNTKKSTIASDEGKSIAYIDDFEGAKRVIPIGVNYTGWKDLSVPDSLNFIGQLPNRWDKMNYKAKSFWYTVTPSDVVVDSIYGGRKQVARSDQQVTVLDYVFMPDTPGTYNRDPFLQEKTKNWGGMMRLLSSTANNLVEQNVEFVEFWMQIKPGTPPDAVLNLDIGRISEDVIPNNKLDTEDKNNNQAVDEGEDTGIDGIFDAQEKIDYTSYLKNKPDPAGDDFFYQQRTPASIFDYFNINGGEGNAVLTDVGLLPDTEDLNLNGTVDLANDYYRYSIPLTTDPTINPFIAGGGFTSSNWYLYRIPLKDFTKIVGSPSLSNVETIRMYVQGVDSMVHIRLTEFNLVGNQWQKLIPDDTVMTVSVVSYEENPDYTSPPGVFRERDRTRPDEKIYQNEQSLDLIYQNLPEGQSREAVKYLFRPLDVFNYAQMKLFIYGDPDKVPGHLSYNDPASGKYSSEVFYRFGTDTNNYYEYRQPVDSGWNSISINFSELTAVKQAAKDTTGIIKVPVPGLPGHFYVVKGNPTLTAIKYLSVGVFNLNDPTFNPGPLSGEIWVNELRVVGADDSPGWAYTFNTSLKFADLMTVNFNMSQNNPYFHKLSDRFGSRVENQNWALSTDLDVLKLLPFNLRDSNLKLSYSHSESLGKPLYIPGTDVKVEEAAKQLENAVPDSTGYVKTPDQLRLETQTLNISNSISSSNIKLKIPTDIWFVRDTWNALSFGFNYNNRFSRSPTILESTNWLWNGSINYGFNFSPDLYIKPSDIPIVGFLFRIFQDYKDLKIYFTPQNFSANVTASRNRNSSQTRPINNVSTSPIVSQDFTTGRGFSFNWKLTEGGIANFNLAYNVNMNSSLADILTDSTGQEKTESEIWNDIVSGAGFGKDYRYQQSVDLRTAPRLPSLWDINRYFTLTAGYSVGYQWSSDLRQIDIGRSAGFSNKFSAGMILRWKSLTEPLFGKEQTQTTNKTGETKQKVGSDSTGVVEGEKISSISKAFQFLKSVIKYVFFDWDNFTINYSHDYGVSKSGIKATGTGFYNFWGVTQDPENGPSRAFQLGLSSDVGPRAFSPNGNTNLNDVYSEKNNLDFKTARPLWEGAKIDLNWNVNWSENRNVIIAADQFGNIAISNVTATGSLSRSFLSLPQGLPFVESGINKVHSLYNPNAEDPRKNLSDAFVQGFESFPFLSSLPMFSEVSQYIPRANWRITWDGLEKFLFFKSIAQRMSLDHSYTSTYTEGWKLTAEGKTEIQTQRVEYGFSPLAGLNITFGQLWGGNLSGSIKFSSRTSYDLGVSTSNINETLSKDIGFTGSYSKSGFEVPLFGISLKNDVEFSFSYTSTRNSVVRYEMNNYKEEGIPQDGTTRTTLEPRIKYTISSKVTLSIFYKHSSVEPEGAARIPPTTTNEAGLDVNIVIQ